MPFTGFMKIFTLVPEACLLGLPSMTGLDASKMTVVSVFSINDGVAVVALKQHHYKMEKKQIHSYTKTKVPTQKLRLQVRC